MILQRYIVKNVLNAILLVSFVLLSLTFVINLLGELQDTGQGDYYFLAAVLHVVLELPTHLYQFFPMVVLLGSIIGLGWLASHHELIAMRAAGFSLFKIALSLLIAAFLMTILASIMGETIAPKLHSYAEKHKQNQENYGQSVATISGVWMHEKTNFIHINNIIDLNHLEGVTRYQFDDSEHLQAVFFAKMLQRENHQWVMHEGVRTNFLYRKIISTPMNNIPWDLDFNPKLLIIGLISPPEMPLPDLYSYIQHLKSNGLQSTNFQFEFWRRAFQPLTTLVMVLLALPLVLITTRTTSIGLRILFGVLVGFSFYMLNAFLGQFSVVFQFPPVIAALLPLIVFGAFGLTILMNRLRG